MFHLKQEDFGTLVVGDVTRLSILCFNTYTMKKYIVFFIAMIFAFMNSAKAQEGNGYGESWRFEISEAAYYVFDGVGTEFMDNFKFTLAFDNGPCFSLTGICTDKFCGQYTWGVFAEAGYVTSHKARVYATPSIGIGGISGLIGNRDYNFTFAASLGSDLMYRLDSYFACGLEAKALINREKAIPILGVKLMLAFL